MTAERLQRDSLLMHIRMHIEHVRQVATNLFTCSTIVIASFYVPNLEARKDIVLEPITYINLLRWRIEAGNRQYFDAHLPPERNRMMNQDQEKEVHACQIPVFFSARPLFQYPKCAKCEERDDGKSWKILTRGS